MIRPIKVTLYWYQGEDKTKETLRRIKYVSPTRHDLSDTLTMDLIDEASAHRSEFHLTKATHILLDAPIMNWFPDADAQIWNHGILAGDMTDNVEAFEFSTDEPCGSVSLTNVYFEISPLEITNWVELHNSKADEIQVPGAIWIGRIGRNGTHFAIKLFPRLVTSSKVLTMQFSSLYYEYCAANGKFWTNSLNKDLWTPVTGDRQVDKAFFVALTLLRFLSPVTKADPFPLEENLSSNGSRTMIIPVRGQVARLMRLLDSKRGLHWYVPRDILSKESFSLGRTAYCGTLSLELEVPWSSVDASEIRRDVAEHTGTSQGGSK